MLTDIQAVVSTCRPCHRFNVLPKAHDPSQPILAHLPFDDIAIDLCGPFPTSPDGYNYVLVCVD